MIRLALALLLLALPVRAEQVVAGLSQNRVAITANFDGSEIVVFAAVARDAPPPKGKLDVIVTIEGPLAPVTVWRKARRMGIWVNTEAVEIGSAPSFYAIATTGPLPEIVEDSYNKAYRIGIGQVLQGLDVQRRMPDADQFAQALVRLRRASGDYQVDAGAVRLDQQTLIRADVQLPANLTEGRFRARIFLLREGRVIALEETAIYVQKEGIERFLHRLALDQPALYGLLSLGLAVLAGWLASAAFQWFRR
ncbi:TIGR02186 family protein [Gemmobacter nectariphilus]|uniref:TIGR02186 family protein n=1 Tax=Gemmobacter nectariphilus TaxID=220343 RepID=UPI00041B4590|nr:TIGR02186 family protein [Gemmobacter nectariphilus]